MSTSGRLRYAAESVLRALVFAAFGSLVMVAAVWTFFTLWERGFGVSGFLVILLFSIPLFFGGCWGIGKAVRCLLRALFVLVGCDLTWIQSRLP
jgi:hypothetical protein